MAKILVLYYSAYGHIETMANAVVERAREAGAQVDIKRIPELVPDEIARKSYHKLDQLAPIATVEELVNYDAIINQSLVADLYRRLLDGEKVEKHYRTADIREDLNESRVRGQRESRGTNTRLLAPQVHACRCCIRRCRALVGGPLADERPGDGR